MKRPRNKQKRGRSWPNFKKIKKICPQKVNIARKEIKFLGIVWSKDQSAVPEARLLAFKQLPSPNTPTKLKTMICALGYYRKFVPAFADLTTFLNESTTVHHKQFK